MFDSDLNEVPNPQVLNAADDFYAGYEKLMAKEPGEGGFLAALHCGFIAAVELYLKSLFAAENAVPDPDFDGAFTIYAKIGKRDRNHILSSPFAKAPAEFQEAISQNVPDHSKILRFKSFSAALEASEPLFMASRYPFEEGLGVRDVDLTILHDFLVAIRDGIEKVRPNA